MSGANLSELTINGARFTTIDGFYDEVERVLIPKVEWGRNLGAFADILAGGFGTPEAGFTLRWLNSERSRKSLGSVTFDTLVSIIRDYSVGSEHEPYRIDLILD